MKKLFIVMIALLTALVLLLAYCGTSNEVSIEEMNPDFVEYVNKINLRIYNDPTDYTNDPDIEMYQDLSDGQLAVLVSNKDYPVGFLHIVAGNNGFDGYADMVRSLVNKGFLVYIPAYTTKDGVFMAPNILTPNTVGYEAAVEAGVIK